MRRIRIKNFGPIRNGFEEEEGWISVPKITVFIGDNGSGKSIVAKLISMFAWIEKALFQGRLTMDGLHNGEDHIRRLARYHKIENFFEETTQINYKGLCVSMDYEMGQIGVIGRRVASPNFYKVPKIMYIGSERNLLSAIVRPERIKGLPESLATLLDEYNDALSNLAGEISLPVEGVALTFEKQRQVQQFSATLRVIGW